MAGHGGKREGAGRKPLTLEYKVRDLTSPHIPGAVQTLVDIMNDLDAKGADRISAARLLLAYYFGQPKQQTDITTNGDSINVTSVDYSKLTDDDIRRLAEIQRKAGTY